MKKKNSYLIYLFATLVLASCSELKGPKQVEFRGESGPPTLISAETMDVDQDGRIDHYRLTFDRNIKDTTFPGYISDSTPGNATTRWLVAGYSNVRFDPTVGGDVKNDKVVYLAFDEGSALDTGATPDLTTTSEPMLEGVNTEKVAAIQSSTVAELDKVPPVFVDAISPLNTSLYLRFSERIYNSAGGAGDTFTASVFTYANTAGGGATTINTITEADGSDGVLIFGLDNATVAGDFGQDSVSLVANSVFDASGNAATGTRTISGPPRFVTDGPVYAMVEASGILYIGGAFNRVGPYTGSGVFLNKTDGQLAVMLTGRVNGTINTAVADGAGGYFIGGTFTKVGNTTRNRLARINANGSLHSWNPDANGEVLALAVSGSVVYAGGTFTTIGSLTRNRIAAIDATSGGATTWDADANDTVRALAVSGNTIYAGGSFTSIGGQTRNRIAALNDTTGSAILTWDANSGGSVYAIAVDGTTIYAGGSFTSIGGQTRNRIAALNDTTGSAILTWNPNATSGIVHAIAVSGSSIYAGGTFTTIGGQSRNRIAALDNSAGNALVGWDAATTGTAVYSIIASGTNICVAGDFTAIGGQSRSRLACLDATNATATSWNPGAAGIARTLAAGPSSLFAGGDFGMVNGWTRNNIAAITIGTGYPTDWNPDSNGTIYTMAAYGTTLYVGGNFTSIGGQTRNRIAALDTTTGLATTWNPNSNNTVRSLAVTAGYVYAGGDFSNIGGAARNYLSRLNRTSGNDAPMGPSDPTGIVRAVLHSTYDNLIYVGGDFSSAGGATRYRLAAIDPATGNATTWHPYITDSVTHFVNTLLRFTSGSNQTILAGGAFLTVNGSSSSCGPTSYTRNNFASFDATTAASPPGCANAFSANTNGAVSALAISGTTIYVGGDFTTFAGSARNRIAAITNGSGSATAWDPNANGTVNSILVSTGTVFIGGAFTAVGGMPLTAFAAIDVTSGLPIGY